MTVATTHTGPTTAWGTLKCTAERMAAGRGLVNLDQALRETLWPDDRKPGWWGVETVPSDEYTGAPYWAAVDRLERHLRKPIGEWLAGQVTVAEVIKTLRAAAGMR